MDTHSRLVSNTHHLIYRSEGGADCAGNKREMRVKRHDAIHSLFPGMLPQEQIKELYSMNKQVFVEDVCKIFESAINEIIGEDPRYVLKKGLYVPRRH